jgi:hypothetical protein
MIVWRIIRIGSIFIGNIRNQLKEKGYVELSIFVCPSYKPVALLTDKPEEYVWDNVRNNDLFAPRIPKMNDIIEDLRRAGISMKLNVISGDTDPQTYLFPVLSKRGIDIDPEGYSKRVKCYTKSLKEKMEKVWEKPVEVISMAELETDSFCLPVNITTDQIEQEIKFFGWLFSEDGPYKGIFNFSSSEIIEMVKRKFQLYGEQGWIVSKLMGGLVLQTETPWLLRTQMLKSTGAPVVAIYPWIRKEESCRK